jgi:hypothetical protein
MSKAAKAKSDFGPIYTKLKAIMQKYERGSLKGAPYGSRPDSYCLIGPPSEFCNGKPSWFGAVTTGKAYVSYHLIAVYAFPDLLNDISPELKKRMQGKSCFNFKAVDEELFKELASLTEASYKRCKEKKFFG